MHDSEGQKCQDGIDPLILDRNYIFCLSTVDMRCQRDTCHVSQASILPLMRSTKAMSMQFGSLQNITFLKFKFKSNLFKKNVNQLIFIVIQKIHLFDNRLFLRLCLRPRLHLHQRHRRQRLRVLHPAEQVRHPGRVRSQQEEGHRKFQEHRTDGEKLILDCFT